MKRKKSAFEEKSIERALGKASRANWRYARSNSDVIMFDVDVTTCVALFLTNILHLKPFVKKSQSQNCQESLVLLQFYSILQ